MTDEQERTREENVKLAEKVLDECASAINHILNKFEPTDRSPKSIAIFNGLCCVVMRHLYKDVLINACKEPVLDIALLLAALREEISDKQNKELN